MKYAASRPGRGQRGRGVAGLVTRGWPRAQGCGRVSEAGDRGRRVVDGGRDGLQGDVDDLENTELDTLIHRVRGPNVEGAEAGRTEEFRGTLLG
jgi:hypothetical protein